LASRAAFKRGGGLRFLGPFDGLPVLIMRTGAVHETPVLSVCISYLPKNLQHYSQTKFHKVSFLERVRSK